MAEEQLDANLGISRRTLIKRGAIVGGAVWAAPAITSFGSRAIGQTTNGTPAGSISYVALVVQCDSTIYRVKFEADSGWEADPGETPGCTAPTGWSTATPTSGANLGITVTGNTAQFCFDLPSNCTFLDGVAMGGGGTGNSPQGFCAEADNPSSDPVCFSDPIPG